MSGPGPQIKHRLIWSALGAMLLILIILVGRTIGPRDPRSKTIKVAAVQYRAEAGRVDLNRNRLADLVEKACRAGAEIIVLPEMCTTGLLWDSAEEARPFAETIPGETTAFFGEIAQKRSALIVLGLMEARDGRLYNSQAALAPDGSLAAVYRKVNLYLSDQAWASPGDLGYVFFETDRLRLGLGICYDINFSSFTSFHRRSGIDILLFSANWIDAGPPRDRWRRLLSGCDFAMVAANNHGREKQVAFSGGSLILDRCGRVLAEAAKPQDGFILAEIELRPQARSCREYPGSGSRNDFGRTPARPRFRAGL